MPQPMNAARRFPVGAAVAGALAGPGEPRPTGAGDRAAGATVAVFLTLGLFGGVALSVRHQGAPLVALAILGVGVLWAFYVRVSMAELERKVADARVRVARAEAESREKTEFLASMSQELRTPMSGVL